MRLNTATIYNYIFLFLILILPLTNLKAGDFRYRGQLSLWGRPFNDNNIWNFNIGARYFPELTFEHYLTDEIFFDTEISLNTFVNTDFDKTTKDVKLYRLKFRFATSQSETRIGLQQFNFGPARVLRSLKWFDKIDPRDPLGMTDGVYGIRFRYSFLDNSEIWLWGLYGNKESKGFEILPSAPEKPEFGGRVQVPVSNGEVAATVHTRQVDANLFSYRENRYALDGRWDIEIGFWFESVFQQSKSEYIPFEWQKFITLGADYTFAVGNGLYVVVEHMGSIISNEIFGSEVDYNMSTIMMSYPIGIMDNITAVSYYSWEAEKFYQYLQWQRTYDYFSINLGLYNYPSSGGVVMNANDNVPMSGFGIQIMFIYNH